MHATFFTLGWIAERYPDADPPHRRRRARAREPRLRASPRDAIRATASSWPTSASRRRCSRTSRAPRFAGIARPASRSGRATAGPSSASRTRAIATARASIRSGTITTAPPAVSASRTKSTPDCSRCRSPRCASCGRRGPRAAAATSGCCRTGSRAGRFAASTTPRAGRRCSTSTRGSSIPSSRAWTGAGAKARFRHYLNLGQMESRLRRLVADFRWDRVDRIFLNGGE